MAGTEIGDRLACLLGRKLPEVRFRSPIREVVVLKLGGLIPVKWLSVGGAMLMVCAVGSAQTKASTARHSEARLLLVSSSTTSYQSTHKSKKSRKTAAKKRGQQKIDPERSREIQEALIREHYMDGAASGVWDAKSQSAMERFQADNGWQSKVVPDSRALIKLGLGPDHEHLLNPESAMTSLPQSPRVSPMLNQTPAVVMPPQR